ncbi:MAG: FAD-dependent oxidoreductase [Paracoccaceae bacterium]|nr:FAD-dependent oxidoreductase [Paracoccaceae bacterium]
MTLRQTTTDTLVIGGGIVGLMTAWYLMRDSVDVTLVEAADDTGTQASGANAGSLHLQIQYPEFVAYGEDWARAYAPTLRFLSASIDLWKELPSALEEELDVALSGGLVVATTDEQMRLIETKAQIEASVGVQTDILDSTDVRCMAPYLTDAVIGAGFCAREGKANPLRVTPALMQANLSAGVKILRQTRVTAIERREGGFDVSTTQGCLRSSRVVNCAGAAAAEIAAMVGLNVELGGFPLQVTVTEPVAPTIPHLVYSAAGKLTLKQLANGGCVIGGGWSAAVRGDGSLATDPSNFARNMAMACEVVPAMSVARPVRSWTAWVNGTNDWRPVIGEAPNVRGFFLALFPWVGFSAGPMTARVTADLVQGRKPSLPLKGISILLD